MEDLYNRKLLKKDEKLGQTLSYYPAIRSADMKKFAEALKNEKYAHLFNKDVSNYKVHKKQTEPIRETDKAKDTSKNLPSDGMLEVK